MDTPPIGTWYVSRRLALPLPHAASALDAVACSPHAGRDDEACRLAGALTVVPTTPIPGVARRLRGRLGLPGLARAMPVELELAGWSHAESELGLRPLRRPGATRADRYFDAATGSVDHVARVLLASAAVTPPKVLRRAS
jgi:hypothetical protein